MKKLLSFISKSVAIFTTLFSELKFNIGISIASLKSPINENSCLFEKKFDLIQTF